MIFYLFIILKKATLDIQYILDHTPCITLPRRTCELFPVRPHTPNQHSGVRAILIFLTFCTFFLVIMINLQHFNSLLRIIIVILHALLKYYAHCAAMFLTFSCILLNSHAGLPFISLFYSNQLTLEILQCHARKFYKNSVMDLLSVEIQK